MISAEVLTIFLTATVALSFAPGPDNVFVLTQSALHGRRAGIWVTFGLCTGLLIHTMAISLGVAAIFQTSAFAFNILKIAGALYLLYLAWQAFTAGPSRLDESSSKNMAWQKLYSRGVLMNITNPKIAVFFLAFLPQFADPSKGDMPAQLFILGSLFIVATILIFGSIAWFAGFLGDWLKGSPKAQINMSRIAGIVFIGLAFRLAISEN